MLRFFTTEIHEGFTETHKVLYCYVRLSEVEVRKDFLLQRFTKDSQRFTKIFYIIHKFALREAHKAMCKCRLELKHKKMASIMKPFFITEN